MFFLLHILLWWSLPPNPSTTNTIDIKTGDVPTCIMPGGGACSMQQIAVGQSADNPGTLDMVGSTAYIGVPEGSVTDAALLTALQSGSIDLSPQFRVLYLPPDAAALQAFTPTDFELSVTKNEGIFIIQIPVVP